MANTTGMMLSACVRNACIAATPLIVAALPLILPAAADAQSYPGKPLRLVVGLPAGGAADAIARIIASKLSDNVAQPVIVENRPGSAAHIAAETVARSNADGYTLLFGGISNAIAASLYKTLPYDAERDFAPVSMLATLPSVLVVNVALPTKSVAEFVAYAKAHPRKMSYASTGAGGALHLSMEMLKSMTGIDVVHVPYKGGVQAIPDLLSGQIQVMFEILPTQLPYLKAGKTRALAVTTLKRSAFLPDVPTMIEAGVAGFEVTI